MAYTTQTNLENLFSKDKIRMLTDDDSDGAADAGVLLEIIANADALIDGWIGRRYTTPVSPTPVILITLSNNITFYMMFARRGSLPPDNVQVLYDGAIEFLKAVSEGEAVIPGLSQEQGLPKTNRDFEKDREWRGAYEGGLTDSQKAGTFGSFDDGFGF